VAEISALEPAREGDRVKRKAVARCLARDLIGEVPGLMAQIGSKSL